jgi:hypothetical protein
VAARCIAGAASGADWLCEGLAEYVGERVVMETHPGTELGAIPHFAEQMQTCRRLLYANLLPASTDIFLGRLGRDHPTDYAIHWAFFRFLMEPDRCERTREAIARIREIPWSDDADAAIFRVIDELWPEPARADLTLAFHEHVRAFVPRWRGVGGRFEVAGTQWMQVGFANSNPYANCVAPAGRAEYSIRGSVEILPRGDGIADVRLGQTPQGWVVVGFLAGKGVGIWLDADGPGATTRGTTPHYSEAWRPVTGRRSEFEIRVAGGKLRVVADSATLLELDLGARDMTGGWGVGCVNYTGSKTVTTSAAIWRDVRLE